MPQLLLSYQKKQNPFNQFQNELEPIIAYHKGYLECHNYCQMTVRYNQNRQFHKMGNDNSTSKRQNDLDLSKDYKQIKKDQNGTVLLHNETKITYLLKELTYGSEIQFEKDKQRLEKQSQGGLCDNILNVVKIKTHTIHGLCSTTYKIFVVYEYPQVTLQDQIQARLKQENRFDQHQLWSILQSCNYALSLLRPSVSLNTHQVFITPDGQIKTIHNDMLDQNYRFTVNPKYLYAPQKIKNFNKLDTEVGLIKQAVFSMGMTLLQAAILDEVTDCYDYNQQLFLQQNLTSLLQSLNESYSQDFVEILGSMLQVNPTIRSSFADIQKMLDNYWNNENIQQSPKQKIVANGESLNIQAGEERLNFLTSQEGIFKNLVTVASNEKESVRQENSLITSMNSKPPLNKNKVNQSLVYSKQTENYKNSTHIAGFKQQFESTNSKQNIYTDPKLLAMIKKDLADINKLKLSALQQPKYSIPHKQTESIFASIKDATLSLKTKNQSHSNKLSNKAVVEMQNNTIQDSIKPKQWKQDKTLRQSIGTDINIQEKFSKLQISKESFLQRQNQMQNRKLMNSMKEKLSYSRFRDEEGRWYEGYVLNGKKQGNGKLMFQDGAFYEGQFKNGQMHGKGVLYYNTSKPAYDGMWFEDQFHGQGILYNECPVILKKSFNFKDFENVDEYWIKYEGQFCQDYKCGLGILYLTNGETIEAMFQQDCVNGEGRFTNVNGKQINGLWAMNRLLQVLQL